jgi:hypothetical protein
MLSQLENLIREADGRYATDAELLFLNQYLQTARSRFSAYQKIQAAESKIIQQVYQQLQSQDPGLFQTAQGDMTSKWQRDTTYGLRYCTHALLANDPDTLQDQFLLWFQSIMRAYKVESACNVTYSVMQTVVRQHLTPAEADLFCPILELARSILGQ